MENLYLSRSDLEELASRQHKKIYKSIVAMVNNLNETGCIDYKNITDHAKIIITAVERWDALKYAASSCMSLPENL